MSCTSNNADRTHSHPPHLHLWLGAVSASTRSTAKPTPTTRTAEAANMIYITCNITMCSRRFYHQATDLHRDGVYSWTRLEGSAGNTDERLERDKSSTGFAESLASVVLHSQTLSWSFRTRSWDVEDTTHLWRRRQANQVSWPFSEMAARHSFLDLDLKIMHSSERQLQFATYRDRMYGKPSYPTPGKLEELLVLGPYLLQSSGLCASLPMDATPCDHEGHKNDLRRNGSCEGCTANNLGLYHARLLDNLGYELIHEYYGRPRGSDALSNPRCRSTDGAGGQREMVVP
ncbi:hypothetical protein BS17DRAFT_790483 [Gyrodon lividus]|nr:hypothetical protein BS17DRAFT_790483 [Gyrodon lividus]